MNVILSAILKVLAIKADLKHFVICQRLIQ